MRDGEMIELDSRWADGIHVRLLWRRSSNDVAIAVFDSRTEEQFTMSVDPAEALDAFRHPFVWAALHRHASSG